MLIQYHYAIFDFYVCGTFALNTKIKLLLLLSHRRKSERRKNTYLCVFCFFPPIVENGIHVICNCPFVIFQYLHLECARARQ